jgi:hypothetical protein
MSANFNVFKSAISTQFALMSKYPLYRTDVDKDQLWQLYLSSFPAGTNPIYRERTEYDCSCCRSFIRSIGDVVAVVEGRLVSLWNIAPTSEPAYDAVAASLASYVLSRPIAGPFYHYEPTAGIDKNFEQVVSTVSGDSTVKTWKHFFVNIPRQCVKKKDDIPTLVSAAVSAHDVLLRSLNEISIESLDTVLDLIAQNSLYRGEEHRALVEQFRAKKTLFDLTDSAEDKNLYAWLADASGAVSRFRNTVIGTLCVDLSNDVDLDSAVRSFESKVAPHNYKRPSALITPAMIAKAKETVHSLGLTSALERRFARLSDITINNVLWADRQTSATLKGDDNPFDELSRKTSTISKKPLDLSKIQEVPIDKFLAEILPRAESLELLFDNSHVGNLVSLIAPVDPTSLPLFKWGNNFSWSYTGEVADAIKERVKKAGGSVTGDLCCRLAWSNTDDLDLHMKEPGSYEIYFGNRYNLSPSGGRLDVDMNVMGETREPVENIFYSSRRTMKEGTYHLFVHQYRQRESDDVGFQAEIDYLGKTLKFSYTKPVRRDERITIAKFTYTHKGGLQLIESLPTSESSRTVWNLPTQVFHRVESVMFSPNFWDGQTSTRGNRHLFFMLHGCTNDGTARGFYNEFLREELNAHRKVFEVLASKTKPEPSTDQLSGLGFSSTRKDAVICRVKGSFNRVVKIVF